MLDTEEATGLAGRFLAEKVSHDGMTFSLAEGERTQVGSTFHFDCQSIACLRTGDLRGMAVGTGHVRVDGERREYHMLGATESAQLDLF